MNITEWWFIKEKRYEFYERAGLYLLYAFILSICVNPFIMLAVGLDKFNYVTIENRVEPGAPVMFNQLNSQQLETIQKYKVLSQAEQDKFKTFADNTTNIILISLLGWIVTSPGWNRKMSKWWVDSGFDKYL